MTSSKIRWISFLWSGMLRYPVRRARLGDEAECCVHLHGVEVLGEGGRLAVAERPHVGEGDLERGTRSAAPAVPADRDDGVRAVDVRRRLDVQLGVVLRQFREELAHARMTFVAAAEADRVRRVPLDRWVEQRQHCLDVATGERV